MDLNALFKISHGVYLTGAKDDHDRLIGSCIDSVMVVETDPQQVIVSMHNNSYTTQNVKKSGIFTLSILPQETLNEIINLFGTKTSKDVEKWATTSHLLFYNLPVYKESVAYMFLKVKETKQTTGHHVFLCDVIDGSPGNMDKPLLYADYQMRKSSSGKWRCTICNYIYNGEIPFENLPDDWVCPLCNQPKSVFVKE